MNRLFMLGVLQLFIMNTIALTAPNNLPQGFVYLHDVDPTIQVSLRYGTDENFVGKPVNGYKKPVVILTKQAAEALKKAQAVFKKHGYCIVVYDAYRPQEAVDHFWQWAKQIEDQTKKKHYFPRVCKTEVFDLGYVYHRSGHSRGSTVDITIIKDGANPQTIKETARTLRDGYTITFLDDGTIDMGSSFDLFDTASHFENDLIDEIYKERRNYLKTVMNQCGFNNVTKEWWHFTLKNEPFPADKDSSYHNFPIE